MLRQQCWVGKGGAIASIAVSFLLLVSGALTPDTNHEIVKVFWELSEHAHGEPNSRKGFECGRCPQATCIGGQCE